MKKILFLVNIISFVLIAIYIIFIKWPFAFVPTTINLIIIFIFNYKCWSFHICKYPLNEYKDYQFNPEKDCICDDEKTLIFKLESDHYIYKCLINIQ